MVQTLVPVGDESTGSWVASSGGNHFADIDETVASADDDTTYIKSTTDADICEFDLTNGYDPLTHTGYEVNYRVRRRLGSTLDLDFKLLSGAAIIDSWSEDGIGTSYADFTRSISAAKAATIDNFDDLQLQITRPGPTASGHGEARITAVELELPEIIAEVNADDIELTGPTHAVGLSLELTPDADEIDLDPASPLLEVAVAQVYTINAGWRGGSVQLTGEYVDAIDIEKPAPSDPHHSPRGEAATAVAVRASASTGKAVRASVATASVPAASVSSR